MGRLAHSLCLGEMLYSLGEPATAAFEQQNFHALSGQFKRYYDACGTCADNCDFGF
jgi:hypothetical protein